ncbi:MAG: DMT family transporter [Elusimicrobiales bacterium]|nr:DMT family transporter [Elusimicrobiales bacterium]
MPDSEHSSAALYFRAAAATAVWGASYPFTKQLMTEVAPLTIVVSRAAIGIALLVLFGGARLAFKDFRGVTLWRLFVLSVLGVSAQQYIQAYALKSTLASNAGWLICTIPIMVAGLAAALGERLGFFKLAAFALGTAGTLLVVFGRSGAGAFVLPSTKGDLIFLVSCVDWTFYVLFAQRWLKDWPQAKVTAATMLVALASVLPAWLLGGGPADFAAVSSRGWAGLAYLGVLSSAVGYLFWNSAVEGLGGVKASYFIYLQPFSAMLASYLLLGEKAAIPAFFGGLLILAGVYLVGLKDGRRKFPEVPANA